MSSSDSNPDDPQPGPSQPRKRVADPSEWKFNKAKKRRNLGQTYTSKVGKRVEKRKIGEECNDGCFTKITRPIVNTIHSDFWALGDYMLQNTFIQKHCKKKPVKRHYVQLPFC